MSTDYGILLRQKFIDAFTMLIVAAASIGLLIFVAYGEARRTYDRFEMEKLSGQAALLRGTIEENLRAGMPIRQYAGFTPTAQSILDADQTISGIAIRDLNGTQIFESGETVDVVLSAKAQDGEGDTRVIEQANRRIVAVPLRNRFEQIGFLTFNVRNDKIGARLRSDFRLPMVVGAAIVLLFAIYTFVSGDREKAPIFKRMTSFYAGAYLLASIVVVYALLSVYSSAAQDKARTAAHTLAARIDDIANFGLDFKQFDGVDSLLKDFRRLNPDVSGASIVVDGVVAYSDDPTRVEKPWTPAVGAKAIDLTFSHAGAPEKAEVIVEIPTSFVLWQVASSAKNFVALFVSSSFLAFLFMELGGTLRQAAIRGAWSLRQSDGDASLLATTLIKPAYFLAVFVDSLSYPFLPQYVQKRALAEGVAASAGSAPFIAYYICFALALAPGEWAQRRFGPRALMLGGLALCLLSFVGLVADDSFYVIAAMRACAGLGQGFLFIGVQSYILSQTHVARRTQAAGIIVFGFQAGTMAGMAIGSLLVAQLGEIGIWMLAAGITLATLLYLLALVPDLRSDVTSPLVNRSRGVWRDLIAVLTDLQFIRSMALIGVPAKAIMTGVVLYAMPILLIQNGFAQEEVGQMTMLYAGAVLIASSLASRFVDNSGRVEPVLFAGAVVAGFGLFILGSCGVGNVAQALGPIGSTIGIGLGLTLLGAAHGFINAPVITNVANSPIATQLGAPSVAANYRLLERVGHVAGPAIMAQLFGHFSPSWQILGWIAGGTVALGLVFISTSPSSPQSGYNTEPVK